ncbi:MAG: hypothetical protein M9888_12480 [Chitinophagales bacterium]|nr:hypothetical protein [Chitinophagales bacterium]
MNTETSNTNLKIELRYRFDDENKHSMNAEIFNECERQFIKAIKSTEKYFEDTIQIKIKPREEGSLIDILTVTVNSPIFGVLVGIFATKFFDSKLPTAKHKTDETSKKLENLQTIKDQIKTGTLTEDDFDYIASNDKDLRKYKSSFFKSVKQEKDVVKIESTTKAETKTQPIIIIIDRKDFDNFIITKTTEEIEETQEAKIYIVAPILIKGRRDSWKGIIESNNIDFKISDKEFLQQVWNKHINFQNGTFINCELKTITTTNIETEETKISREVINVANYGEDDTPIKAIAHRKKHKDKGIIQQPNLFSGLEDNDDNE